jgi:LPS-assembly lipoprotein
MWWRKALLPLLLALAGCGFHPLYGENAVDPNVSAELASIHVEPLRERQGQLIHNALLTALSPRGEPERARYHLAVALTFSEGQEAISADTTSTRDVQNIGVTYRLYDDKVAIAAGTFNEIYSYNFLPEHYSSVAAETDIQRRAAETIANEIRNRLAGYFTQAYAAKAAEAAKAAK